MEQLQKAEQFQAEGFKTDPPTVEVGSLEDVIASELAYAVALLGTDLTKGCHLVDKHTRRLCCMSDCMQVWSRA